MSDWTVEPYDPETDRPPEGHHHQGEDPPDLDHPIYQLLIEPGQDNLVDIDP